MIEGHGDDLYKYDGIKMNFSSNTNCYADLKPLEQHLKTVLEKAIASYPEPQPKDLKLSSQTDLVSCRKKSV